MTSSRWAKFAIAMAGVVLIVQILSWTAKLIYRDVYPTKLAVEAPGFEAPLVDRASLQRRWPAALNDLGARAQLRAHMRDVENLEVPKALAGPALEALAPAPAPDLATLLATADIASGERRVRICAACHTFDEGGRDGVGPNLWSVVGRDIAATAYDYSSALASEPGSWTFEKIDAYLRNPNREIPGNKMAFQGLRRARDRADIIAYLRMQGAAQIPLPEPAAPGGGNETQQNAEEL